MNDTPPTDSSSAGPTDVCRSPFAPAGPDSLLALSHRVLKHHDDYFRAKEEAARSARALRLNPGTRSKNRARQALAWTLNAERRLRRSTDKMRDALAEAGS